MHGVGATRFYAMLAAVVVAAVAVMMTAIVDVPFFTKGEPREALVVQQMAATGNPVLPMLARGEIQSKPPLFHWLGLAVSSVAGTVTEASVRVPSIAASALVLVLTALAALRTAGPAAALTTAVVLATSVVWLQASTIARVDMTLAATTATAVLAFERGWSATAPRLATTFWLAAGAGVLAKGPVGAVLPLAVVAIYLAVRGELSSLARPAALNLRAAALGALVPLAWYIPAAVEGGRPFLAKHLLDENVFRVLDAERAGAGHVKPFWFYAPALLAGFAPWSLLLPAALVDAWRRRARLDADGTLLAIVWVVTTVAFYSLAGSKRGIYLLSCYPALALIVGRWFARRFVDDVPIAPRASLPPAVTLLPATVAIVAATLVLLETAAVPAFSIVAPLLSRHDAANLLAVSAAVRGHAAVCIAWGLAATATAVALICAGRRGRPVAVFALVAVLVATSAATVGTTLLPDFAHRLSIRALLEPVRSRIRVDEPLSFFGSFDYLEYVRPAVAFYAGRAVPVVDTIQGPQAARGLHGAMDRRSWFLVVESRLDALRAATGRRVRVVGRHADGDSPGREPLLLVEVAPATTSELP